MSQAEFLSSSVSDILQFKISEWRVSLPKTTALTKTKDRFYTYLSKSRDLNKICQNVRLTHLPVCIPNMCRQKPLIRETDTNRSLTKTYNEICLARCGNVARKNATGKKSEIAIWKQKRTLWGCRNTRKSFGTVWSITIPNKMI